MLAWGRILTQYCMHAECTQIHTQARTLEFMMHVLFQAPGKGTLSKNNKRYTLNGLGQPFVTSSESI